MRTPPVNCTRDEDTPVIRTRDIVHIVHQYEYSHMCTNTLRQRTVIQTVIQTDRQTHLPDMLHEALLVVLVGEEELVSHAHEGGAEVVQGLLTHTLVLTHDLTEDTLEGMLGEGGRGGEGGREGGRGSERGREGGREGGEEGGREGGREGGKGGREGGRGMKSLRQSWSVKELLLQSTRHKLDCS